MRRWTIRILVGLWGLIVVAALTGATYQWLATRKDLAATPPPGRLVDIGGYRLHLWCTGDGAPAVILDTGLGGSILTGASSNLMWLDSRVSAPTTGQVWVTAIPARRRGPHDASRASWTNSLPAAGSADRWCSSGPPSPVSTSAYSLPITPSAPQVSCSWMPPTKTRHMKCRRWRDLFLCCRRSASSDCSACRSARESNRWRHQRGNSRGRRVSAQPDTRRRLTKSFIFGRARRKSGARAASSRSLSSSSPVDEEPTRIGDSCNEIKPRCQNEDV